jgi:hypothetical protein
MSSTVFILYILQKGLLVSGSIRSLVFRINIHSLVPLPNRSQLGERIVDMCRNAQHTSHWSDFGVLFEHLVPRKLRGKESVILLLSLLLGQSSHHAINVIKQVIVDSNNVVQSNGMPF